MPTQIAHSWRGRGGYRGVEHEDAVGSATLIAELTHARFPESRLPRWVAAVPGSPPSWLVGLAGGK